jgi:YggT family protein
MNAFLLAFAQLVRGVRVAVLVVAVIVGLVALVDWLVRTRRISPFNGVARFFRRSIDPVMVPVERLVIRAGGQPASAPWWTLVAAVLGGLALIVVLQFVGGLLVQLLLAIQQPSTLPILLVSWALKLVEFALIVRVIASWLPMISPYSIWVRWSYPLTNWILTPLRRIIPNLGMVDITPLVAYVLLAWVLEPLLVRAVQSAVGV